MRLLRSPAQAFIAATIALGAYAVPTWMAVQKTEIELTSFTPPAERQVYFDPGALASLTATEPLEEPIEEEAIAEEPIEEALEPEPVAEASPPPAPRPEPAADDLNQRALQARAEREADSEEPAAPAEAAEEKIASTKQKQKKRRACLKGDNPSIEQVGDARWRIERELIDYYTGDLAEAEKLASVAWHRDAEGKVDGFRIRRIRCGSVLHEAGLRNGDIITRVNGKPVRNIPQALWAYRKLRTKRSLQLEVTRGAEALDLRYKLS